MRRATGKLSSGTPEMTQSNIRSRLSPSVVVEIEGVALDDIDAAKVPLQMAHEFGRILDGVEVLGLDAVARGSPA